MKKIRRGTLVIVGVPVSVLILAIVAERSAIDTLLGTALGALIAFAVQQQTESKTKEERFHADLIQQVLAPLYTELHTRRDAFRRMMDEGEEAPLDVSFIRTLSSNWLYSRIGETLLRRIDDYTRSMTAVDQRIMKPRQTAYTLTGTAASAVFSEPRNIQTVFCSRGPGTYRSVSYDLMLGRNPFSNMKEGFLVLGDGSITKTLQFQANEGLFKKFWKTAEELAVKDTDIETIRELIRAAHDQTIELDRQLDQEIERLRKWKG